MAINKNDDNNYSLAHSLPEAEDYVSGLGIRKTSTSGPTASQVSVIGKSAAVGRENIASALPPHESYEGRHRWDPSATWTAKEEASVLRKTDLYLLSWLCLMVSVRSEDKWYITGRFTMLCDFRAMLILPSQVLRPAARPRKSLQCPGW